MKIRNPLSWSKWKWWRRWDLHPPHSACKAVSPLWNMRPLGSVRITDSESQMNLLVNGMARRLGAAPSRFGFGGQTARWCATPSCESAVRLKRSGDSRHSVDRSNTPKLDLICQPLPAFLLIGGCDPLRPVVHLRVFPDSADSFHSLFVFFK